MNRITYTNKNKFVKLKIVEYKTRMTKFTIKRNRMNRIFKNGFKSTSSP